MDEEKAENNSSNRFSDDGMETEIEVKQEEEPKPKRRQKKKGTGKRTVAEGKEKVPDTPPPEYQSQAEASDEDESKEGKKATMKKKWNTIRSTPFVLTYALIVCVFLPMAIYACDVIISVNVLQRHTLWKTVFNDEMLEMYAQYPKPIDITGNKYNNSNTMLFSFQENIDSSRALLREKEDAGQRKRRQASEIQPVETINIAPTEVVPTNDTATTITVTTQRGLEIANTTVVLTPVEKQTTPTITTVASATTAAVNTATTKAIVTTTAKIIDEVTGKETTTETITNPLETSTLDISETKQQEGEFCKGIYYFYDIHISQAHKDGSDWFEDEVQSLRNKQQTLFFMFTVIGFIFLLAAIGIRSEMFLNDEWSSYIIFPFLLYSISMAVTTAVFAQENASGGLRCFVCRLSNCSDIDPWNLLTHWPKVPDNDTWALVAVISLCLKAIDCFLIGTVTLKFIWNGCSDPCWKIFLKIAGWMFFFPILIFTPMLGIIRYQVVPWIIPEFEEIRITSEFFFYFGVALWAITLISLPIFCKLRMCGKSREDVEEEIEHEYYD